MRNYRTTGGRDPTHASSGRLQVSGSSDGNTGPIVCHEATNAGALTARLAKGNYVIADNLRGHYVRNERAALKVT